MNCQPAILVHTIAVWRILQSEAPIDVALGAGHSLGEFSAYVASGALSFDEGVRTVRKRGELMSQSDGKRPGGMTVLLGLDDAAAESLCERASAESGATVVPANYNSPGQLVISGDVPALKCAEELSKEMGFKRAIRLNVSGAFHSPLMNVAVPGLSDALDSVHFQEMAFPIVSNVTAQPVENGDIARGLLVEQLTSPVRWVDSIHAMRNSGMKKFVEIGPGNVLAGLVRRIDRTAPVRTLGTAEELTVHLREEA
jgi:[acyl-carrier-protein] S-malonyltransferase